MLRWQIISLVHMKNWLSDIKIRRQGRLVLTEQFPNVSPVCKSKILDNVSENVMFVWTSVRQLLIQPHLSLINTYTSISCCVSPMSVRTCVTDEHGLVYKQSGWWQWQDLMSRYSLLLMPWPYGRVLLCLRLNITDGARSNTAQQNLSHCFTSSNHNKGKEGGRQEK